MVQGWIRLHRKLMDNKLWTEEKFSKGQAWVDMLLMANHKDTKILFDGRWREVKRGSIITSIVKLADRWKWNRKTVTAFLDLLESDGMIERESTHKSTQLIILNYEKYQAQIGTSQYRMDSEIDEDDGTSEYPTDYPTEGTTERTTEYPQTIMIKNDKECNKNDKEKNIYTPKPKEDKNIIPPTEDMVRKYCEERGNGIDAESFCDYYQTRGWMLKTGKMKDWQAAVRTWEKNNGFKAKPKPKQIAQNRNAGLEKYDPNDEETLSKRRFDPHWFINDDGYWVYKSEAES